MQNKKVVAIVLGVMCFALTAGTCVQIRTVNNTNSTVSNNYEENNLRAEVLRYKERYDNKVKDLENAELELEKERESATKNDTALKEKEEKITEGNKILGLTEVTGPGVIVTLGDSKKDASSSLDPSMLLVHDTDVLSVINELKNAGAEAISINDQRIINMSDIVFIDAAGIIRVNGERILAPYTIKAIGNSSYLESSLIGNGGVIDEMKKKDQDVTIHKENNITIPKYNDEITIKHME